MKQHLQSQQPQILGTALDPTAKGVPRALSQTQCRSRHTWHHIHQQPLPWRRTEAERESGERSTATDNKESKEGEKDQGEGAKVWRVRQDPERITWKSGRSCPPNAPAPTPASLSSGSGDRRRRGNSGRALPHFHRHLGPPRENVA
jgi:hypothetical protein